MTHYKTKDNDMLDEVAFRYYGTTRGTVEKTLEANPGLAAWGPRLPAGLTVTLPTITGPVTEAPIRLWD
ncbi:tail protein X [Desulfoluna spongiiphila]|uniref:tail protein X n=1 Tax=Desulfoluna spongiiphila TaxID=419481 RepID=UPI001255AA95|nr:tail protein X [Desulfoluna spongiiphila]VVS90698.1 phage tail protein x-like [Desulfoluna spongiiphila]